VNIEYRKIIIIYTSHVSRLTSHVLKEVFYLAIVSVIRFNDHSGCICVDEESWFLRNRRSFFSDSIFSCVNEEDSKKTGVELILGGVGYPPFHYEVAMKARKAMKKYLAKNQSLRVENLAKVILEVFQEVHKRKVDNRINFMFGFKSSDFYNESYKKNGSVYQIKQEKVRKRVEDIIDMKEKHQDTTLIIPQNEACIIGVSPEDGFHAYCLKEQDGVISYYSCGFDCLGVGKYSGGAAFAETINNCTVKERREGYGKEEGLFTIINSVVEASEHYSQIGGNIHLVVLDSKGEKREISSSEGLICTEAVKAYRGNIIDKEDVIEIISSVVFSGTGFEYGEKLLFEKAKDMDLLDKCLRNYKTGYKGKLTIGIEDMYRKAGVEI